MVKNCKVVMLPQNKEGWIKGDLVDVVTQSITTNPVIAKTNSGQSPDIMDCKAQHLYFISDDPIQEGDWVYHPEVSQEYTLIKDGKLNKELYPAQGVFQWKSTTNEWYKKSKKIVACTNEKLKLPFIPQQWVRDVFVPSQGEIKEVELETETEMIEYSIKGDTYPIRREYKEVLKLTPNNEVIIINKPHTEDFSDITNIEETNINVKSDISIFCEGEKCSVCKKQATHKIKEVIFDDDPLPTRHAKSNYVCTEHFNTVICPYMINQQLKERSYTEIDMINAIKAGRQLYLYESDGSLQEWLENYKKNN